jgi:acetoin utilization deacetylase AcuC-like enzyme
MHIVHSERHGVHATDAVQAEGCPLDVKEVPARATAILSALQRAQVGSVLGPTDHGLEPILAVHDKAYVEFLRTANADSASYSGEPATVTPWTFANRHAARKPRGVMGLKGYYAFGWGTPILAGTWEAAYWSVQCALTAADLVLNGNRVAYALCRPPGHHAAGDLYGGYCYLNNAAIAARYLQANCLRDRGTTPTNRAADRQEQKIHLAILDVDYHHGNGTQIIFYDDPLVLYCSLHVHPDEDYPYYWGDADEMGVGSAQGTNRNWPLPRGTGDVEYLAALQQALSAIREFAPRHLVVSAGFDTIAGDPEGGFCLTTDGLHEIGKQIAGLDLPTVIVQEGGYLLDRLGESAVTFLRAFLPVATEGIGGG